MTNPKSQETKASLRPPSDEEVWKRLNELRLEAKAARSPSYDGKDVADWYDNLADLIRRLAQANKTAREELDWQPIETAAKTGEARLLACPGHYVRFGFWGWGGVTAQGEDTWRDGCRWKPLNPAPTHWRPHPSFPAALSAHDTKKPGAA